jgi:serine/threonine protein kinase
MPTPLATTPDAAALADELARARVLDPDWLAGLVADFPGGSAAELAEFLVRRSALTRFQADRALAGEAGRLVLGPYRLVEPHGPGVLGPLYQADDRTRAGEFVVRVLPLRSLWRVRQAKQLLRTLAALPPHPAVVVPVAIDTAHGFHYLAWPRVAGPTLADRVADRGPLRPAEVAAVLTRLADGLAALHARNTVHGAVCPRAVAAPPGGFPRLLELGVGALLAQDLAGDDGLFDTLSAAVAAGHLLDYAAPELLDDPTNPTPAADQFALGAVGYFALTGKPPYPGETLAARLEARLDGQPVPVADANPHVPPALAAVIDRMLSPDPGGRFPSLDDVRDELAAAGGDELPPAEEPEPAAPTTPPLTPGLGQSRGLPPTAHQTAAVPWASAGTGLPARAPTRDESDASISFDLPPPPPEPVTKEAPTRNPPLPAAETPNRLMGETKPSTEKLPEPRPEPAPGPKPEPEPADTPTKKPRVPGTIAGKSGIGPPLPQLRKSDRPMPLPSPVQYHTADPTDGRPPADEADAAGGLNWRKLRRNLLFWQGAKDQVHVSVYGPPALTPGASARLAVFVHDAGAAASVRTLARAFQLDAELLGTGAVGQEVARGSELAVHLSVANAGVATSLVKCVWRGQPQRLVFELHVPWVSPGGPAPGLVSVGRDNVRIGKAEFRLHIQPRKA